MGNIVVVVQSDSGSVDLSLSVDSSHTVADIKSLLQKQNPALPVTSTSLKYGDTALVDESKTLTDYKIPSDSTLHFALNTPPPAAEPEQTLDLAAAARAVVASTPKRNKRRCTFKACLSAPLRGVGDCGFCEGHYCSKHRLLEQHDCIGLQNCKQQLHERNAVKLHQQQTVANKV